VKNIEMKDIKTGKLSIIQQVLRVEDERLLEAIQHLLDYGMQREGTETERDFWEELTEYQKEQIALSRRQHRAGEGIPNEEVMLEFRKKYGA